RRTGQAGRTRTPQGARRHRRRSPPRRGRHAAQAAVIATEMSRRKRREQRARSPFPLFPPVHYFSIHLLAKTLATCPAVCEHGRYKLPAFPRLPGGPIGAIGCRRSLPEDNEVPT